MLSVAPSPFLYMPGGSHKRADGHVTGNHVADGLFIDVHGPDQPKTNAHDDPRWSIIVVNPARQRFTSRA
jgi:hypothetical protein